MLEFESQETCTTSHEIPERSKDKDTVKPAAIVAKPSLARRSYDWLAANRFSIIMAFVAIFAAAAFVMLGAVIATAPIEASTMPSITHSSLVLNGALDNAQCCWTPAQLNQSVLSTTLHDRPVPPRRSERAAWLSLQVVAGTIFALTILAPSVNIDLVMKWWVEVTTILAWLCWLPWVTIAPRLTSSIVSAGRVSQRVACAANRIRHAMPRLALVVLAASAMAVSIGSALRSPPAVSASAMASFSVVGNVSTCLDLPELDLPVRATVPPKEVSFPSSQVSLINSTSAAQSLAASKTSLPIVCMTQDSGASASSTDDCRRLVDKKPCDEIFGSASGNIARASCKGTLPVIVKTGAGQLVKINISNVRCVPAFKYTLLSITQLWDEQEIDVRFRNLRRLEPPASAGNATVPFDPGFRLPTVVDVSVPMLQSSFSVSKCGNCEPGGISPVGHTNEHASLVGFHAPSSTAHIGRMSAAQAGELIHRRSHAGAGKIRALPQVSTNAPTNLASASPCTCVFCAQSRITEAPHSGVMKPADHEPGVVHTDMKGPFATSKGGFKYAMFFVDEYSRFIFVEFLKAKSDAMAATEHFIAKFNATVGVPVDIEGKPLPRPRFRKLHRDHEGKLESHAFEAFRIKAGFDTSVSAPHDHDLNPIAERAIRTIDEVATAMFTTSGSSHSFWPWHIAHAVNWHNALPCAVGSSPADSQLSHTQRFKLVKDNAMDLCAIGNRTVVLKPTPDRVKGTLNNRGWVGCFLGRSLNLTSGGRSLTSTKTYDVWVPSEGKIVTSSSVQCDEEYFPWRGKDAYLPLTPTTRAERPPPPSALGSHGDQPRRRPASLCNLFSGSKYRTNGLATRAKSFGWEHVLQVDNDAVVGGGHDDDLLNDATYTSLKQKCSSGEFDALIVAFPCSTFSIARFFDASSDTNDSGLPVVRNKTYPDGLPLDQIPSSHHKELRESNLLLDRTVELIIAARNSPARTTIILENPASRSIRGTNQFDEDFAQHGSLFDTSAFTRLKLAVPDSSTCTFGQCRFMSKSQKYTTLWYTNDAAAVLDQLNGPDFQCNHRKGEHEKPAGGRDEYGKWRSKESAAYPDQLNVRLVMAITAARTGSPKPMDPSLPLKAAKEAQPIESELNPANEGDNEAEDDNTPAEAPAEESVDTEIAPPSPAPASASRDIDADHDADDGGSSAMGGTGRPSRPKLDPVDDPNSRLYNRLAHRSLRDRAPRVLPNVSRSDVSSQTYHGSSDSFFMEESAASIACDAYLGDQPALEPVGDWVDIPSSAFNTLLTHGASVRVGSDEVVLTIDASHELLTKLATSESTSASQFSVIFEALRADSDGAPDTHTKAREWGGAWPASMEKELGNHRGNKSWSYVTKDEIPRNRRLHRLVWVFKHRQGQIVRSGLLDGEGNRFRPNLRSDDELQLCARFVRLCCSFQVWSAQHRLGCRLPARQTGRW